MSSPYTTSIDARSGANDVPLCWTWKIRDIRHYVEGHREVACTAYKQEKGHKPSDFYNVTDNILLHCLRSRTTYAYDSATRERRIIYAGFHSNQQMPFTDVFSTLGWFISYSEPPLQALGSYPFRHLCYTRLCALIGEEVEGGLKGSHGERAYCPAMTHLFVKGYWPILVTDDGARALDPVTIQTYSSSLAVDNFKDDPRTKGLARDERGTACPTTGMSRTIEKAQQIDRNKPKGCAEWISFFSNHTGSDEVRTAGFGEALKVEHVFGKEREYVSAQNHLQDAYYGPCDPCTFSMDDGGVTQYDLGTGYIYGKTNPNINYHPDWKQYPEASRCLLKTCFKKLKAGKKTVPCDHCKYRWCNKNCRRQDVDHGRICTPDGRQPPYQWEYNNEASEAGPSTFPLAPGYPVVPIPGVRNFAEGHNFYAGRGAV